MRVVVAVVGAILAGSFAAEPASAYTARSYDPFAWCVHYRGQHGGARNCGFYTFEQCQATASSNIGFCMPNPFYSGPPVHAGRSGYPAGSRRAVRR